MHRHLLLVAVIVLIANISFAQTPTPTPKATGPSSEKFCLFELRPDGNTQRLINLAAIQYVEIMRDELRVVYGGGSLGSGYEARFPIKNREEALVMLQRMRETARQCTD